MDRKKIKKAIKRLLYLPKGKNFIRYSYNKANGLFYRLQKGNTVNYPSNLMFEVTNHCNLHCITCPREYHYGEEMDLGYMDIELLKNIMDQAYPYIDSVGLTGLGEPLLYRHLTEALQYIKSTNKGIITSLSTNASLPNIEKKIEQIKDYVDTLQISIDGTGDVYNAVRRNGNYDKFLENVKSIVQTIDRKKTDVILNAVVVKENYHQMKDLIKLTNDLKLEQINFTHFNLASATNIDADYYDLFYSEDFKSELNAALNEANKYSGVKVTFWDYKSKNEFQKCPFPWGHYYISWDGYLVPCCAKPFPKIKHFGNLNTTKLFDCLNSFSFREFRNMWYKNTTPAFCKKCHFTDLQPLS
jgi:MoaA/NifB/PqqE/SkfB family radical SAM enzyme